MVGCAGVVQPTLTSRFPCGGVAVKFGSGPRVTPSHAAQPGVQPLEKKKQACPFAPEMLRPSTAPREEDGSGHHGSNGSTGTGVGTGPRHGSSVRSTALRDGGTVTAPCPSAAVAKDATRRERRRRCEVGLEITIVIAEAILDDE